MRNKKLLKELLLLVIAFAPLIYLGMIWSDLPESIPMHWNFQGEVDGWGSKWELLVLNLVVNIPIYLLMLFLPNLSAKKESIDLMGNKYYMMRLILQLFMSAIFLSIMLVTAGTINIGIDVLLSGCFAMFMILFGNYMISIRPNYFMGIRTPWTLENEEVWKKTHQLGGRLWVAGGILGLLGMLFLPQNWAFAWIITLMLAPMIVALVYSYILFKQLKTH